MSHHRGRAGRAPAAVLLLAAALVLPALAAHAATYYVSVSGNDASSGSQAAPWRTIAKANSTLAPGDVCVLLPGTYANAPNPAASGTSGARITYVGSLSNPQAVVVPTLWLDKAWVTVKGVRTTGGIALGYTSETAKAWHDSVAYVYADGDLTLQGAKDCMVARCTINGPVAMVMNNLQAGPPGFVASERDTIRRNTINVGSISNGKGFALRGFTQRCLVDSNRISQFFAVAYGGDLAGRYLYNSYFNTFRDNRWTFESDGNLESQYVAFALRDSSSSNLFERDTMLCGLASGIEIGGRLVNSGNSAWVGQCRNNRWNGCYYLMTGYAFSQDLLNDAILENSVFASLHTFGLFLLAPVQNTIIRNCTIASWSSACMRVEGDIRLGGNQIHSNIFYVDSVAACYSGRPVLFHGWPTGFTEDHNLFYARTGAAGVNRAGQSLYWSSSACSAPGPGTPWATATGNDTHSAYGDPLFVNSGPVGFDPHLRTGSAAIGRAMGGGDAGAYPFGGGADDVTPPAAVTNLAVVQVSDANALLTWTAPGNDGTVGTAAAYDLRVSTAAITEGNFAAATPVGTQPAVLPAGSAQSYAMLGLTPSTTYYFALKTRDAAGNWSALSNVAGTTTTATDVVPPARITDFR